MSAPKIFDGEDERGSVVMILAGMLENRPCAPARRWERLLPILRERLQERSLFYNRPGAIFLHAVFTEGRSASEWPDADDR
jgi:hypothetical protein